MDVLFLAISMGGGHIKAAQSLKEKIEQKYPGSRTLIVDTLKYINPIIDKVVVGGYINTVKNTPQVYGKIYDLAATGDNINDFSRNVTKLLSFKIKSLIDEFKPSVIVCTHPFPLHMISNMKKKKKLDIPTLAILTDYVIHSLWLHDYIDAYVVAHEYMKFEMVNKGMPENIIFPYGLPVSESFSEKKDRSELLEEFGLEDKLTAMLMGGSLGFGEIRATFESLINLEKDMQIIAVTGSNKKLKTKLEKYISKTDKNVKVFGYTDRVADLMEISDFIITKPGGLTISESLVKELPLFIMSPIPGHEEGNAHFLINNGMACRITENDDIASVLHQIIDNPLRTRHMSEMAKHFAKPDATDNILALLEDLVKK